MDLKKLEKYQELFNDIEEFDVITREDMIEVCLIAEEKGLYDHLENTIQMAVDTENVELLIKSLALFEGM